MDPIEFKTETGHLYATLAFNEELKCFQDIWLGAFESQENFKKVLVKLIELFEKNKAPKILTDLSLMVGSFDESRVWVMQEIIPRLVQLGLRYQAVVIPNHVFMTLAPAMDKFEKRLFSNRAEAQQWLLSV